MERNKGGTCCFLSVADVLGRPFRAHCAGGGIPTALPWAGEGNAPSVRRSGAPCGDGAIRSHGAPHAHAPTGHPSSGPRHISVGPGHAIGGPRWKGGAWDALSGLRVLLGTVFPRRCRGLAREMHLWCAGPERLGWMVRFDHMARHMAPHTRTPQQGTLLPAHGNAVGNPAPIRARPNGASFFQPMATPWGTPPPYAHAPTGHPSSSPRQRRGEPAPTCARPNAAPISQPMATPWGPSVQNP